MKIKYIHLVIKIYYRLLAIIASLILMNGIALGMGVKPIKTDYNLLLITIDTLRADHLGCYGYKDIHTPVIDKLASEGFLFKQAITPAPITLPAHSSIMTGIYPHQHGVRNNGNFYLSPDLVTLAEVMKGNGYATGAGVGSFVLDSIFGLDQGFDMYDDNFSPGKRRTKFMSNERSGSNITKIGAEWMDKHKGEKFFLWLHYFDPHAPYFPPLPFRFEYKEHLYNGEIAYVDSCLGELFKSMEDMGLMNKTVIIVTADHGEGLGDHNELTHAIFIYDTTLRVPLIVHIPGFMGKGKTVSAMVSTMDIFPTVLDLFGFKPITHCAGKSLIPLMTGDDMKAHTGLLCESMCPELNFGWSSLEGIRTLDTKYIHAPVAEFYDLNKDNEEKTNLFLKTLIKDQSDQKNAQNLSITDKPQDSDQGLWEKRLENLKKEYPPLISNAQPQKMDPETQQKLKSLGYIWTKSEKGSESKKVKADPKDKIHLMNSFDNGMNYFIMGSNDEAIKELEKVIKEDTENITAYFFLAYAHENKGELDIAEEIYNKVLELDNEQYDAYDHLGLIEFSRQNWEKAQTAFQRALEFVQYSELYYNLSLVYAKKGELENAIQAIKKAIELDPDYAENWNQLGTLFLSKHDIQGAIPQFEKTLKLDPTHFQAHNNLGLAYLQIARSEDALKQFQAAVILDPNNPEAHNNLGGLYAGQGKYEEAIAEMKKALDLRPEYLNALTNLGIVYMNIHDFEKAEQLLNKALLLNKNHIEAYRHLGNLYLMKKEYDRALPLFKEIVNLSPNDSKGYYDLGKAYYSIGQTEEAIAAWKKALAIQPNLPGAHLNLGNTYFEMGNFQDAETEWRLAFEGKPIDIPLHLANLGKFYYQSEQYEKAIQAWQKAIEFKIDDFDLHYNSALAYLKLGKNSDADMELRECLRIQPDSQKAQSLLDKIKGVSGNKF